MIRRIIAAVSVLASLSAFAPVAHSQTSAETRMQSTRLSSLSFLVGRWSGQGPDGSTFYEEYDFAEDGHFRSRRFADETFSVSRDGSSVVVEDDQVISKWGPYSWRATRLEDGLVEFEPVNAPSSFSWRRVDDDHVEVAQHWTDEAGVAQGYTLMLTRIGKALVQ